MMELLNYGYENYEQFKASLDGAMHQAAESFVRIGYLLRQAKETNILEESGYQSVNEFAKQEYGLSPDQVSRYIAINERFADGGQQLREGMQGYGIAKLQIMLTMPDEVVEAIPQEVTKAEVTEIQKEVKEEQNITDLEVMMEPRTVDLNRPTLEIVMSQYFWDHPEQYLEAYKNMEERPGEEGLLDVIMPSAVGVLRVRVQGLGMYLLTMRGEENPVTLLNVRAGEKKEFNMWQVFEAFRSLFEEGECADEAWENEYGETFAARTKKAEIAPVQKMTENVENIKSPSEFEKEPEEREQNPEERDTKTEENCENIKSGKNMEVDEEVEVVDEEKRPENGYEKEAFAALEELTKHMKKRNWSEAYLDEGRLSVYLRELSK